MDRLDGSTRDSDESKQSQSMLPVLLGGAIIMFGFFVWATVQVSAL